MISIMDTSHIMVGPAGSIKPMFVSGAAKTAKATPVTSGHTRYRLNCLANALTSNTSFSQNNLNNALSIRQIDKQKHFHQDLRNGILVFLFILPTITNMFAFFDKTCHLVAFQEHI